MKAILTKTLLAVTLLALPTACAQEEKADQPQATENNNALDNVIIDTSPLERSNEARIVSFADVVDDVTPAVVSVTTKRFVQRGNPRGGSGNPMEEFFRRYYGIPSPQPTPPQGQGQEELVPFGAGSGFIVSSDGYVMTNNHVVSGGREDEVADEIQVKLPDGREYTAEVIGTDPQTDVAIIKINADNLPHLPLADSDQIQVGDIVFAVGNPLSIGQTVTQGIVSAIGRTGLGILGNEGYENFIQTDAAINRGNSGGPLVDAQGRVIGMNTAIIAPGGGNIGIGFAIPINLSRNVMASLLFDGKVRRGFLGVNIQAMDRDLAESLGLQSTLGALVTNVEAGLPADRAGIRHGDVITKVEGETVNDPADLRFLISRIAPGEEVNLTIVRQGQEKKMRVRLGDRDELISGMIPGMGGSGGSVDGRLLEGVQIRALNDELRAQYEVPEEVNGMMITSVAQDSPYARKLVEGMVLIQVNGQDVTSADALKQALNRDGLNHIYLWIEGRNAYDTLRVEEE